MIDVITYCKNIDQLRDDIESIAGKNSICDSPILDVVKTQVIYNGKKSIALVRLSDLSCREKLNLNSIEILGTYDQVFSDPEKMIKYTSVYSIEPYEVEGDGKMITIEPPKKFGVFA